MPASPSNSRATPSGDPAKSPAATAAAGAQTDAPCEDRPPSVSAQFEAAPGALGAPPASRLGPSTRWFYAVGGVLEEWGQFGFKNTAGQVLNIIMGLNPAAIGLVVASARVWDAFFDPVVGAMSDNSRTRWGRRRPFLLAGGVLCAVTFPLTWCLPPGLSSASGIAWLAVASYLFYTAFAFFSVPFNALGYEIAPGYHEKTQIQAARVMFKAGTALGVAWIFPVAQSGVFGAPRESAYVLALIIAGVLAATAALPAIFIRERADIGVVRQRKIPIREGLSATLGSRPFRIVLGTGCLGMISLNLVGPLGTYVIIYYMYHGDLRAAAPFIGIYGTVSAVLALLSAPLAAGLSRRFGKRETLGLFLGLSLVGTISKWFLFTPGHTYLPYLLALALAPGNACLQLLASAMVADTSDYEQWTSGRRIAGYFGATYQWILKAGLSLTVLISGVILTLVGFDIAKGAGQDPQTIFWLRLLFAFVPTVGLLWALFVLRRYPLTSDLMHRVRADLDRIDSEIVKVGGSTSPS